MIVEIPKFFVTFKILFLKLSVVFSSIEVNLELDHAYFFGVIHHL